MKKLITIFAILVAFGSNAQVIDSLFLIRDIAKQPTRMKAVKVDLTVDFKFEIISNYMVEIKQRINRQIANETLSGNLTNEALTLEYIAALKVVEKQFRPRFMKATETTIEVDSLAYRNEQATDTKELNRLKAAINLGQDSTVIQPKINHLKNKMNDRNKIMLTWTVVL